MDAKEYATEMDIVLYWLAKQPRRGNDDNDGHRSYITSWPIRNLRIARSETESMGWSHCHHHYGTKVTRGRNAGVRIGVILARTIRQHLWSRCFRKRQLTRRRTRCTHSVKINFREDSVQWQALVYAAFKFQAALQQSVNISDVSRYVACWQIMTGERLLTQSWKADRQTFGL